MTLSKDAIRTFLRSARDSESLWRAGMFGTVAFFILSGMAIVMRLTDLGMEARNVSITHHTLKLLGDLLGAVKDEEIGQRGFILTLDPAFLGPKEKADRDIPVILEQLERLAAKDPQQLAKLQNLSEMVERRIAEIDYILVLSQEESLSAASKRIREGLGKNLMDEIRAEINKMEVFESSVLRHRLRSFEITRRWGNYVSAGTILIVLLVALFMTYLDRLFRKNRDSYNREIKSRRAAEESLQHSESRLRTALLHLPLRLYSTDLQGRYTWLHSPDGMPAMTDILGKRDDELFNPSEVSDLMSLQREVIRTGKVVRQTLRLPYSGELLSYDVTIEPELSSDGKATGVTVSAFNIERQIELQRDREQFIESERAARNKVEHVMATKEEYITTLTHELRGPLNSIIGWTQLLRSKKDQPDLSLITRAIDVIEQNARNQSQLVSDLFEMQGINTGKVVLDIEALHLPQLLEAAADNVLPACNEKNITLIRHISQINRDVFGDARRITQVVMNLLNNSLKFTPPEGSITLALGLKGQNAVIEVSDSGIGIEQSELPHIFDRYNQGSTGGMGRNQGLGLGLAIARSIIQLHAGKIEVASEGVGKGTTFKFQLPCAQKELKGNGRGYQSVGSALSNGSSMNGLRILLVEDQDDAREALAGILTAQGAEVFSASSGAAGLILMSEKSPQIIISDISMPEMDGHMFIKEVRRSHADIPAIALTALTREEDRQRAFAAGFNRHVAKPLDAAYLIESIRKLVAETALEGQNN